MGIFADYAPELAEYNLSVLPADGKRIRINNWTDYCLKHPDDETIEEWAKRFAGHNIGLCTGPASGLIGFDVDTDDEKILSIIDQIIPKSKAVKRGLKGFTAFYKYSGQASRSIKAGGFGVIDILSDGRQTIIPPSIHPDTNKPYVWLGSDLVSSLDDIFDLPESLINKLAVALGDISIAMSDKNGRNNALKSYVAALADRFDTETIVKMTLHQDKMLFGENALFSDKNEFRGGDSYINCYKFVSNIKSSILKEKKRRNEPIFIDKNDYPTKNNGFFHIFKNKRGDEIEKPDFQGLGQYLVNEKSLKNSEAFSYYYDDNHYKFIGSKKLKKDINLLTQGKCNDKMLTSFYNMASVISFADEDSFKEPIGFLNLNNGILDVKNKKLLSHSPEYFFKYKLDHDYIVGATCDNWLKFLLDTFQGDKDLVKLSQMIFGYTLIGGSPWLHKAFVLYGSGRNGKSTYLNVLKYMIGRDNYSGVPIDKLEKPFSAVMLDGQLANICGEVTTSVIASDSFKTAVGGEELIVAHKNKPEYMLPVQSRFFFASNKMPTFKDTSIGAYEKLCIIPFSRYISPDDRIADYEIHHLYPEISGVINWAIDGANELLKLGRLPKVKSIDDMLNKYRQETDSVYQWFHSCTYHDDTLANAEYLSDWYSNYVTYCKSYNYRNVSLINFSKAICSEIRQKYVVHGDKECRTSVGKTAEMVRGSRGVMVRYVSVIKRLYGA